MEKFNNKNKGKRNPKNKNHQSESFDKKDSSFKDKRKSKENKEDIQDKKPSPFKKFYKENRGSSDKNDRYDRDDKDDRRSSDRNNRYNRDGKDDRRPSNKNNRYNRDDKDDRRPSNRNNRYDRDDKDDRRSSNRNSRYNRDGKDDRRSSDRNNRYNRDDKDDRRSSSNHRKNDDKKRKFSKDRPVKEAPRYNTDKLKELAKKKNVPFVTSKDDIRLNRYIANAGVCSRREADDLIANGEIKVNGKIVTEMGYKVKRKDEIKYKGEVLKMEKKVYVLLNKPKGFITTSKDPFERKTVMQLVNNACPERIYPVGRLDRNTSGLLLFTNDGDLSKQLAHPSGNVQKIYHVVLDKPLTKADFEDITQNGVTLDDGPVPIDGISMLTDDMTTLGIELHSGKNRIVRRIFEHYGYVVDKLDRTVFAGLSKIDLPRGKWRYLSEKEVIQLKYFTGKNKKKKE